MDSTTMLIALLTLIITAIGVYYTFKSYKKKTPATAKQTGKGDAIVGDKIGGDKVGGDKIGRDKIVFGGDKIGRDKIVSGEK